MSSSDPPANPSAAATSAASGPPRRRWGGRARTACIALSGLVLFSLLSLGGAEYYTSRPDFCGTCHIMDAYYKSWAVDPHGPKVGARCVDCHYAPGEQHTVMAKFKGLSQVASYFSGRYGTARPRAHVDDRSCLTSGCHGNGEHLTKKLPLGAARTETRQIADQRVSVERTPTVHFTHEKHLDVDQRLADATRQLEDQAGKLRKTLTIEQYDRLSRAVCAVGEGAARAQALKQTLADLKLEALAGDAAKWAELEHSVIRLRQLQGLNCSACHTYDATGAKHFSVDHTTCYTCHFTGESFNSGTGTCLKCHEPPVRKVAIHAASSATTGPALMDHKEILARGIDCGSCHFDVIQGETKVTARECTHCHDQDRYLKNFDARTTTTVQEYHEIHVAHNRARCTDCHRAVQHRLIDPVQVASSAAPLEPVLNDCQHCHPRHHQEQVNLLMGVGGEGAATAMPNSMFGSRVNCRACHTQAATDIKGDALVAATKVACVKCHDKDYERQFDQWQAEIKSAVEETERRLTRINTRIDELKSMGRQPPPEVNDVLARTKKNLHLIKSGEGIHNKQYSMYLLDLAARELDDAILKLGS